MKRQTDISIVVVGYNSREVLRGCIESIAFAAWDTYSHQVVYVDNASVDGSCELVRTEWPDVLVLKQETNVGFCEACNLGAAAVDSRFIYLLNVDTVLFKDSVTPLADLLERMPGVGAAGNRLLNADFTEQWSARRFPTWRNGLFGRRSWLGVRFPNHRLVREYLYKDELAAGEPFNVDWIPGSCTLVRREAFEQVGGLPADMHYWSDAVFCDRLHRAGWDVFVVPASSLLHLEGNGTGRKPRAVKKWLITDFHQGAYRFHCEHHQLGPNHPARWVAKATLGFRAQWLMLASLFANHAPSSHAQNGVLD